MTHLNGKRLGRFLPDRRLFFTRIRKTVNNFTRKYVFDGEDVISYYGEDGYVRETFVTPFTDENLLLEDISHSGAMYFYFHDLRGSVANVVRFAKTTYWSGNLAMSSRYVYYAFGCKRGGQQYGLGYVKWDSREPVQLQETCERINQDFEYAGRRFDDESGLMEYRARTYDPLTGRFTTMDPIGLSGGANRYLYVRNNPVVSRDPFGWGEEQEFNPGTNRWYTGSEFEKLNLKPYGQPTPDEIVGIDMSTMRLLGSEESSRGNIVTLPSPAQGEFDWWSEFFSQVLGRTVEDVYGFGKGALTRAAMVAAEPVLEIYDITRLCFGEHKPISYMGEAAARGAGTGELLWGMVKGIVTPPVVVPYRFGEGVTEHIQGAISAQELGERAFDFGLYAGMLALGARATKNPQLNKAEVLSEQRITAASRSGARAQANKSLLRELETNPETASQFAKRFGETPKDIVSHMKSGKGVPKNPPGTEWHHPVDSFDILQLLRKSTHRAPKLQDYLHPGGIGGFGRRVR